MSRISSSLLYKEFKKTNVRIYEIAKNFNNVWPITIKVGDVFFHGQHFFFPSPLFQVPTRWRCSASTFLYRSTDRYENSDKYRFSNVKNIFTQKTCMEHTHYAFLQDKRLPSAASIEKNKITTENLKWKKNDNYGKGLICINKQNIDFFLER